jgi:hypothetical protein
MTYTLLFKPHGSNDNLINVQESTSPEPLWSVAFHYISKPNVVLSKSASFCGAWTPVVMSQYFWSALTAPLLTQAGRDNKEIGSCTFPNVHRTTELIYQGASIPMKESLRSGQRSFDSLFGPLEWHPPFWISSAIKLKNAAGKEIGRFDKASPGSGAGKKLEVQMPFEECVAPYSIHSCKWTR